MTHVPACWQTAPPDDAITAALSKRRRLMEIGKPLRKIVVEPIRDPVPVPAPQPQTAPPSTPERVRIRI